MSDACVAKILIAYDGSDFHGWQAQPGLRTVQGELTETLKKLMPVEGLPPGAGRTDAGVHARGQVASIEVADEEQLGRLTKSLPRMMMSDVAVLQVTREPVGFHARHSATGRRYVYRIATAYDPMRRLDHWLIETPLDVPAMQAAAASLVGDHDCTSLCRTSSLEPDRTRCQIRESRLSVGENALVYEVRADRFLHSMVRIIVGTLMEIGQGRRPAEAFGEILAAKDRAAAGATAPPHGLCLEEVEYEAREEAAG